MWPFKKKRRKIETRIIDIPLPILMRQNVYDSVFEDVDAIAKRIGLPPISQEVSDMERNASIKRIARFSALLPFIDAHSDMAARVSATAYLLNLSEGDEDKDLLERELEEIIQLFKLVSVSASVSCISTLLDLDLLDTDVVPKDEHEQSGEISIYAREDDDYE